MQKFLRFAALAVFVPLLAICALAIKCYLVVVGFLFGLAEWQLAWPPVAVEPEAAEHASRSL
ncbi:MAG: hypothetical protein WB561_03095 [Terracidiphilus sp.]